MAEQRPFYFTTRHKEVSYGYSKNCVPDDKDDSLR